jgi:hypothetical protein
MNIARIGLLITLLGASLFAAALPASIAGITPPESVTVDGSTLVLNGVGKRTRYVFVDVYVAALYLRSRTSDPLQVLADPGPKRLSMTLLRSLTADQLAEALRDGMRLNNDADAIARLSSRIDALVATMQAIGTAPKGDTITLDFLADGTTQIADSGHPQGKPIAGADFQRALLEIWLGDKPAQPDLKQALLGLPP